MFQSYERLFPFGKILYELPKVYQLLFLKITFIILHYQSKSTCRLDKNEQKLTIFISLEKDKKIFFCSM